MNPQIGWPFYRSQNANEGFFFKSWLGWSTNGDHRRQKLKHKILHVDHMIIDRNRIFNSKIFPFAMTTSVSPALKIWGSLSWYISSSALWSLGMSTPRKPLRCRTGVREEKGGKCVSCEGSYICFSLKLKLTWWWCWRVLGAWGHSYHQLSLKSEESSQKVFCQSFASFSQSNL